MKTLCPQPTPFAAYTEPTCSRDIGHEPPHRFVSGGGRTDLEQFPTAREIADRAEQEASR